MTRKTKMTGLAIFGLTVASVGQMGCDTAIADLIRNLLSPQNTSIVLVNNSDFAVEGRILIDDEQNTTEEIIEEIGTEISFSVAAGEMMTITRDCDLLQAMLLDDANLQVIGGAGPDARTEVLRDGSDFNCGDQIILTFDHSEVIVDFDVSVSIVSN